MTEYAVVDLRTGRRLTSIPVVKGPWTDRLGQPESITATLSMRDPAVQRLGIRAATSVGKTALCVFEGDAMMAGGPIWTRRYNRDAGTLELGAAGMASLGDHRLILPTLAATIGLGQWLVPDPADPKRTIPNPLLATSYTGIWLGTIAKGLWQQALAWTGGQLPMVYQSDEASANSDHDRTYQGTDFKLIGDAWRDLSKVQGGPEVNIQGRRTADRLGVEWLFQTGTAANPLITSPSVLRWDLTAPNSPISGFEMTEDGTNMASLAWQTGGRQADTVMVARAFDPTLTDAGYPLMESFDSSHTDVSYQSTLDGYAAADAALGLHPASTWSFDVQTNIAPFPSGYWVGDFADVKIARYNRKKRQGDPFYAEGGIFRRRLVGRSGDEKGLKHHLEFAPTEAS